MNGVGLSLPIASHPLEWSVKPLAGHYYDAYGMAA